MLKRFTKISMLIVCCATVLCLFAGCSSKLAGGPSASANVYGNGGLAVVKGDYVYYVNGYTSYEDINKAKDNKDVKKAGIYRTKLVNGAVEYAYNEDDVNKEYSHTLTKTEQVVSKVAGHENTKLYIFDNYIYYSTPHTDKDDSGKVRSDYLDFYVCNLNSTGNKKLYSTQATSSNQDYTFAKIGNTVYLICYDGTSLVIVNTSNKDVNTISKAVTSVTFNEQTNYFATSHSVSDFDSYVYYTRANSDENATGNILAKAKIATGAETVIDNNTSYTYKVLGMQGTDLFYAKKDSSVNGSAEAIYQYNINGETRLYTNLFTSVKVVPYSGTTFRGLICEAEEAVYLISAANQATTLINQAATVLKITSSYVYTLEEGKIYKREIANPENKILVSGEAEVDTTMTKYMSVASNYVFFYTGYKTQTFKTNYYLNIADTSIVDAEQACAPSFIGLFIGNDKPVETYSDAE